MIGQIELRNQVKKQIENNVFPHFCILVGSKGSGKKTLAKEIGGIELLNAITMEVGISASDIRRMIENSHKMVDRTMYIIPDADTMSPQAKNALLKVTEEPPNDAYFIMTLEDLSSTLPTIISRATVYRMESYNVGELQEYLLEKDTSDREKNIIFELCDNIGEIESLLQIDVVEFADYVNLVADNIAEVSGANCFKIADNIAVKKDGDGYDLKMFLKAFMSVCLGRLKENPLKYSTGLSVTSKALQETGIRGISKQMLLDDWILKIREEWM